MYNFTCEIAAKVIDGLKSKGYAVDPGLNNTEISRVEETFQALLPPDFKIFLQTGVIRNHSRIGNSNNASVPYYPDWRNPEQEVIRSRDWIEQHVFKFDIEKNNYWHKEFGEKPNDVEEAVHRALSVIRTWPSLFPVHGHRFIPSSPHKTGNPVLSIWQATDTVYYGMNLLEHFNMDFHLGLAVVKEAKEPVPFWGDVFDLN
ncbi:MAG TPA: hypothetical protein VFT53_00995 [Candidatus Saccharimonadales bacterium]|nr:hypothetical protein [Candidatus Saccharimonadales bacterium]